MIGAPSGGDTSILKDFSLPSAPLSFILSPLSLILLPQGRRPLLKRSAPLPPIPYTLHLNFIKYYERLNLLPKKSPKVAAVSPDKEVEGKITVGKGGG